MSPATGPDERDVAAVARLLKRQLAEHEPDTSRTTRVVMERVAASPTPAWRRGIRPRTLVRWVGVTAAVAGVAAAVVAGVLALRPDSGTIVPVVPATPSPPSPTTEPSGTPTAGTSEAPTSEVSSAPAPTASTPGDPATSTPTGGAAAAPGESGEFLVSVVPATDLGLLVSGPSTDDFVVAGVDAADPFVTARRDGSPQVVSSGAYGDPRASVETGAFVTSWDGGEAPYGSGTAEEWFVVRPAPGGPDSGVVVQAAGASAGDRVVLHVGVAGPQGRIEVVVDGEVTAEAGVTGSQPGGGTDFAPYVVTVALPDPAGDTVGIRVLAPDGGAVGLAAAQLNPA